MMVVLGLRKDDCCCNGMAIKYVREDFRNRAKGVHREPEPVQLPTLAFPRTRWTRIQVLSLLAVICALLILDGLQEKRQSEREHVSVEEGFVSDKWIESMEYAGPPRHFVEIAMPYGGDDAATVVAECEEAVWNSLDEGVSVSVSFYTEPRDGMLVIRSIAPLPPAGETDPSTPAEAQDHASSEPSDVDFPGFLPKTTSSYSRG